ncbi:MAG: Gfo/Idh/MocA family oxidoreductase [Caldilineaceae bacterium]
MNEIVNVALVGAGGYGDFYLRALAAGAVEHGVKLVGVVDPTVAGTPIAEKLSAANIPLYPTLDALWQVATAQLVVIAAPIQFHSTYTRAALALGANVLCEKPLCATLQEAAEMQAARQQHGGFVGVGYQWSFSAAMGALKADILAGRLGTPRRCKAIVLWPRTAVYYGRNNWAGRLRMPDGRWVLDSPVSNATAHYLHNLFYLLGDRRESSAQPVTIQAELYHANPIQNCDTAALRCTTANGVEILYYTSHAVPELDGPRFQLEFDDAVVTYRSNSGSASTLGPIVATLGNGEQKVYGDPFAEDAGKLWQCADAVRTGASVACDLLAATAHVRTANGMHESMPAIQRFPADLIQQRDDLTWVTGLQETLMACYEQNLLPSTVGNVTWASAGRIVNLADYTTFPQDPTLVTG